MHVGNGITNVLTYPIKNNIFYYYSCAKKKKTDRKKILNLLYSHWTIRARLKNILMQMLKHIINLSNREKKMYIFHTQSVSRIFSKYSDFDELTTEMCECVVNMERMDK